MTGRKYKSTSEICPYVAMIFIQSTSLFSINNNIIYIIYLGKPRRIVMKFVQ